MSVEIIVCNISVVFKDVSFLNAVDDAETVVQ